MKKSSFTLIELLVVIMLAAIMLLMGASAYNKISGEQALITAANLVQNSLERARANAIKTRKTTWVYFLDGDGDVFTGTLSSEKEPYEVVVAQDDEAGGFTEIARAALPPEIAWVAPPLKDPRNGQPMRNYKTINGKKRMGLGILYGNERGDEEKIIPDDRHCGLVYIYPPKGALRISRMGRSDKPHELRLVNIDQLANYNESHNIDENLLFICRVGTDFAVTDNGNELKGADLQPFKPENTFVSSFNRCIICSGAKCPITGCVVGVCECGRVPTKDELNNIAGHDKLFNLIRNEKIKRSKLEWKTIRMDSDYSRFTKIINGREEAIVNYFVYKDDGEK